MYSLYLNGPRHRLLVVLHVPESSMVSRKWVLHVPAFAEEMNKSRAMVSAQSRAFARKGVAVVIPDLRGTGDSEGDFSDATWEGWVEDIHFLLKWVRGLGAEEVALWGLRLGALLALDAASREGNDISELLLWQPVFSGKQAMTQFLRLRMAAGMMQGRSDTVTDLRNRLRSGENLEVAGYTLSTTMLIQVEDVEAASIRMPESAKITVLEVTVNAQPALTPVVRKQIENWRSIGIAAKSGIVCGEPFWSTQEISFAPALIEASLESVVAVGGSNHQLPRFSEIVDLQDERALVFDCLEEKLLGILHQGDTGASCGILLVVGGPQYRPGSHRQFTMLARDLAKRGVPVFRFDYRGMGDSSGEKIDFLAAGDDIRAALDAFQSECPALQQVVIWGLCDAATAAAFYAPGDSRVAGLILLNPWVRSEAGEARAYMKHYYLQRLLSTGLWRKIIGGEFNFTASFSSLLEKFRGLLGGSRSGLAGADRSRQSLAERMEQNLAQFRGRVLFILSGNDLTAAEFTDAVSSSRSFTHLLAQGRISIQRCPEADHTFSKEIWKSQVAQWTAEWVCDFDWQKDTEGQG